MQSTYTRNRSELRLRLKVTISSQARLSVEATSDPRMRKVSTVYAHRARQEIGRFQSVENVHAAHGSKTEAFAEKLAASCEFCEGCSYGLNLRN